ncbi:fimbria/pilus periplasmic chaperone [Pluralibacter gergoviae]|uniref:fimbria/pilus periplasmic chaperone n=1 Tax=Pluralibacter gergoviae TaxID=61647 RepID=UPI003EE0ECE3
MKKGFLLSSLGVLFISTAVHAGGIALGSTRIIYPHGAKQAEVSTRNTSDKSTFLVQSWVENASGEKDKKFFVTPPLFTSAPGNENKLRLMYVGPELPKDRESLFYFNSKAIPSVSKSETENKNILVIAATTRIKLFVRPDGLKPSSDKAPGLLRFSRSGNQFTITNPTPYYITIGEMKIGGVALKESIMVAPMDKVTKPFSGSNGSISIRTINDYGAYTPPLQFSFQ